MRLLSKKEKIAKLKKEHKKPYVVIDKPEKLLLEKLKSRTTNNSLSKSSNNLGSYSAQSTQSCYTLEIDVWAFEKYHSKSGFIVGILPKSSYNYPDNKYWQYDRNILTKLKYTYGFSKIVLEPSAIVENANTIYQANEILAGFVLDPDGILNFINQYNLGTYWGCYIDEPMHTASSRDDGRLKLNSIRTNWKNKYGDSSLFIVGETTKELASEFYYVTDLDFVNQTMYSDYQYLLPYSWISRLYYVPTENDQRDVWTDFNNSFGAKFNHLWISGELDRGEMDQLIGHAKNMGKNSIWLYAGV